MNVPRVYIDTPWEDVQRQIFEVAVDELCDPEGGPSARDWAEETATIIAKRVMARLDGSTYETDKDGLRWMS